MGDEATGATGAQTGGVQAAGTQAAGAQAAATPAPFAWKDHGVDPVGEALIAERQWKNPGDLLNSYRNLEKLTGVPAEQIIKLPASKRDAQGNVIYDAAEWGSVYDRLGRPKDPAGYKLPVPQGDNGEFAKEVSKWMYEAGLSEGAGRKLAESWNKFQEIQAKTFAAEIAKKDTEEWGVLKNEWGVDFEANVAIGDKAAEAFGMTTDHVKALKMALGSKEAMKFLFKIGSKIAVEDKDMIRNADGSPSFQGMSPDVARAEINRLSKDKAFSQAFSSNDPQVRQEARARMSRLNQIAYGVAAA